MPHSFCLIVSISFSVTRGNSALSRSDRDSAVTCLTGPDPTLMVALKSFFFSVGAASEVEEDVDVGVDVEDGVVVVEVAVAVVVAVVSEEVAAEDACWISFIVRILSSSSRLRSAVSSARSNSNRALAAMSSRRSASILAFLARSFRSASVSLLGAGVADAEEDKESSEDGVGGEWSFSSCATHRKRRWTIRVGCRRVQGTGHDAGDEKEERRSAGDGCTLCI